MSVYGPKFTIFSTLVKHAVYRESVMGVAAENFEIIANKTEIFTLGRVKPIAFFYFLPQYFWER